MNPIIPLSEGFREDYNELAKPYVKEILSLIDKGLSPRDAVEKVFAQNDLEEKLSLLITASLIKSIRLIYPEMNREDLIEYINQNVDLKKLISDLDLKEGISNEINTEIKKTKAVEKIKDSKESDNKKKALALLLIIKKDLGLDFGKLVRKLERLEGSRLSVAYKELLEKARLVSRRNLEQVVKTAILEKSRYAVERVAFTEIARFNGLALDLKALSDSDIIAIKFSLNPRHKIYDICDIHTKADFYKMGAGVYPKDSHPGYPFHPFCMCSRAFLFQGEAEKGKYSPEGGKTFLSGISEKQRKAVLGIQGSKDFAKTGNWEKNLKNWNGHEKIKLDKKLQSLT